MTHHQHQRSKQMKLTPEQELFFGTELVSLLNLKEKNGLYKTDFGVKTAKSLGAMIESLYHAHIADNKETHINSQF
jgi:hypothetical protein